MGVLQNLDRVEAQSRSMYKIHTYLKAFQRKFPNNEEG